MLGPHRPACVRRGARSAPPRPDRRARLLGLRRDALVRRQGRQRDAVDRPVPRPARGRREDDLRGGRDELRRRRSLVAAGLRSDPVPGRDAADVRVASLCVGLALFLANRTVASMSAIAGALLAVAVVPYATWVTETPRRLRAPLAFSIWRVWRDELDARWIAVLSAVVALDYFQTKVIGIMALGSCSSERSSSGTTVAPTSSGSRRSARRSSHSARPSIGSRSRSRAARAGEAEGAAIRRRARSDGRRLDAHSVALVLLVLGELVLAFALARALVDATRRVRRDRNPVVVPVGVWVRHRARHGDPARGPARARRRFRIDLRLALAAGVLLALAVATRDARHGTGVVLALRPRGARLGRARRRRPALRGVGWRGRGRPRHRRRERIDVGDPAVAVTRSDRDIWAEVRSASPRTRSSSRRSRASR